MIRSLFVPHAMEMEDSLFAHTVVINLAFNICRFHGAWKLKKLQQRVCDFFCLELKMEVAMPSQHVALVGTNIDVGKMCGCDKLVRSLTSYRGLKTLRQLGLSVTKKLGTDFA